jgi:hypothetical protein
MRPGVEKTRLATRTGMPGIPGKASTPGFDQDHTLVIAPSQEILMSDSLKLSKPYKGRDEAAMGGFLRVLKNGAAWLTQEFGFWVILKVSPDKSVNYFYTEPVSGGSGEVELTLPQGVIVRGHCHTHPHRISTGNFSTGDKRSFLKLQELRPGIVFYLLNPAQEIRRAIAESEFPAGTTVKWDSNVTP